MTPFKARKNNDKITFSEGFVIDTTNDLFEGGFFSKGSRIHSPINMYVEFPYSETYNYKLEVCHDHWTNGPQGPIHKARIVIQPDDEDEEVDKQFTADPNATSSYLILSSEGTQYLSDNIIYYSQESQSFAGEIIMTKFKEGEGTPNIGTATYTVLPNKLVYWDYKTVDTSETTLDVEIDKNKLYKEPNEDDAEVPSHAVVYSITLKPVWEDWRDLTESETTLLEILKTQYDPEYDPLDGTVLPITNHPWGWKELADMEPIASNIELKPYESSLDNYFSEEELNTHQEVIEDSFDGFVYKLIAGYIWPDGHVEMRQLGGYIVPLPPTTQNIPTGDTESEDGPCDWKENTETTILSG